MAEHRCPEEIFRLFEDDDTKADGRKRAVEWNRRLGKLHLRSQKLGPVC